MAPVESSRDRSNVAARREPVSAGNTVLSGFALLVSQSARATLPPRSSRTWMLAVTSTLPLTRTTRTVCRLLMSATCIGRTSTALIPANTVVAGAPAPNRIAVDAMKTSVRRVNSGSTSQGPCAGEPLINPRSTFPLNSLSFSGGSSDVRNSSHDSVAAGFCFDAPNLIGKLMTQSRTSAMPPTGAPQISKSAPTSTSTVPRNVSARTWIDTPPSNSNQNGFHCTKALAHTRNDASTSPLT